MSSNLKNPKLLRRSLIVGAALLLAGCQARPLYLDETGETKASLGAIAFSEATTRVGQETRNRLIFLAGGGAQPKTPEYRVDLTVTSSVEGVLLDQAADRPNSGRALAIGEFKLTRISDGVVMKTARRQTVALFDYPRQEYARLRSVRDAETRAARELAELIYADLATALGR